jgi:hypothetical protein
MDHPPGFKRIVLPLPHSAKDYVSVAFAAELADLMGVDLLGVFAEDDRLTDLAGLSCVRELRLAGDGWHRLDAQQLERGLSLLADEARRQFREAARALRVGVRFDLARGQIGETIFAQSMAGDIIAIVEPANLAERMTHQFRQLLNAAMNTSASALMIPSRISRRKGPVVVVARGEADPSIEMGLRVAQAVHESLIVLAAQGAGEAPSVPLAGTVPVQRRPIPTSEVGLAELGSLLAFTGERLVVLSRGMSADFASKLAFERGVPVLVPGRA